MVVMAYVYNDTQRGWDYVQFVGFVLHPAERWLHRVPGGTWRSFADVALASLAILFLIGPQFIVALSGGFLAKHYGVTLVARGRVRTLPASIEPELASTLGSAAEPTGSLPRNVST